MQNNINSNDCIKEKISLSKKISKNRYFRRRISENYQYNKITLHC